MTIGDRFRAFNDTCFVADDNGDYIWDGQHIVPEEKDDDDGRDQEE